MGGQGIQIGDCRAHGGLQVRCWFISDHLIFDVPPQTVHHIQFGTGGWGSPALFVNDTWPKNGVPDAVLRKAGPVFVGDQTWLARTSAA